MSDYEIERHIEVDDEIYQALIGFEHIKGQEQSFTDPGIADEITILYLEVINKEGQIEDLCSSKSDLKTNWHHIKHICLEHLREN